MKLPEKKIEVRNTLKKKKIKNQKAMKLFKIKSLDLAGYARVPSKRKEKMFSNWELAIQPKCHSNIGTLIHMQDIKTLTSQEFFLRKLLVDVFQKTKGVNQKRGR